MTREEWKAEWRFCQACGSPMRDRTASFKQHFNRKTGELESVGWCYWECSQYVEGHDQSLYDFERSLNQSDSRQESQDKPHQ